MASDVNHSGRAHALLSPSGAYRWMVCTPSARFAEKIEDKESSIYAREGTLAHEYSEWILRYKFQIITKRTLDLEVAKIKKHELYSSEMDEHVDKYVNFIMEEYHALLKETEVKPEVTIEEKFDLTDWIEEGFGANDCKISGGDKLHIFDLKYGKGIPVDAVQNKQLKLYALGALKKMGRKAGKIKRVFMSIVQPRLDSISTWEIPKKDLMKWAETELKDKAKLAYAGEGEFVAGDHCKFCKAKPKCKAMYEFSLEQAKLDFSEDLNSELDLKHMTNTLPDEDLLIVFSNIPIIQDWLKSVSAYLIDRALAGDQFDGYKLAEGQKRRKVTDIPAAEEILSMMGYTEDQTHNKKLKGIGDLEKLLLKDFNVLLKGLIGHNQTPPNLVRLTVNRKSYFSAKAQDDFAEPLPEL